LYSLLGVAQDCDDFTAKAAFRQAALLVHPDKNPHPQAKQAFDFLQEAVTTITSPAKRAAYDERLEKQRQRRRKNMSPHRLLKRAQDEFYNGYSRFLLLQHRLRHGRATEEVAELVEAWAGLKEGAGLVFEHFSLLPSPEDRVALLHELLSRHGSKAAATALAVSCFL